MFSDQDLNSLLGQAQGKGLNPRTEENVTCCYATANNSWVQDPDGHEWEFWVKKGEAETMRSMEEKSSKQQAQCCVPGSCC